MVKLSPSRKTAAYVLVYLLHLAGAGAAVYGVALVCVPAAWVFGGVVLVVIGRYGIDDGEQPAPTTPAPPRRIPVRRSR